MSNTPTPTPAAQWKGKQNTTEDLLLPSGNVAKVRRPGMQAFVTAGIIPNSLLGIMMKELERGGAQQPFNPDEIVGDIQNNPEKLNDLMELVDSVLVHCVLEPKVELPTKGVERDPNTLYADEVDLEDKFFIFQYAVGGSRDLERFREGSAAMLAGSQPGEDLGSTAIPDPGA